MKATDKERTDADANIRLMRRFGFEGGRLLDCGANVGLVVEAMLPHFRKILAIEAHPATFKRLEKNVKGNLGVTAVLGAVMEYGGQEVEMSTTSNSTAARVTRIKRKNVPRGYYRKTKTLGISTILSTFKPDYIKMDIEGAEYVVLPSANLSRIKGAVIEFHSLRSPPSYQRFLAIEKRLKAQGLKRVYPKKINLLPDGSAAKTFYQPMVYMRAK